MTMKLDYLESDSRELESDVRLPLLSTYLNDNFFTGSPLLLLLPLSISLLNDYFIEGFLADIII